MNKLIYDFCACKRELANSNASASYVKNITKNIFDTLVAEYVQATETVWCNNVYNSLRDAI